MTHRSDTFGALRAPWSRRLALLLALAAGLVRAAHAADTPTDLESKTKALAQAGAAVVGVHAMRARSRPWAANAKARGS